MPYWPEEDGSGWGPTVTAERDHQLGDAISFTTFSIHTTTTSTTTTVQVGGTRVLRLLPPATIELVVVLLPFAINTDSGNSINTTSNSTRYEYRD